MSLDTLFGFNPLELTVNYDSLDKVVQHINDSRQAVKNKEVGLYIQQEEISNLQDGDEIKFFMKDGQRYLATVRIGISGVTLEEIK